MKKGKGKGPGEGTNVIHPHFDTSRNTSAQQPTADRIRVVSDLIHEGLARPAELAVGSSIPPRSAESTAQVVRLKRPSTKRKRPDRNRRSKPLNFNEWLTRDDAKPNIDCITGGTRKRVSAENMAEEDKRAEEQGYGGVRKVYLLIQNTIPDITEEEFDPSSRTQVMTDKISQAVQELEQFYNFRDEDDEPIYTDNPSDPRLFNAVASILVRVWGHNYLNKLNDLRVNTIVLLLNRGDVSWRKLIDLMVEWEKSPSVARTVNRYNR